MPIRSKLGALVALSLLVCLPSCAQPRPIASTPPPAEWTEPVAEPAVPAGASDREVADYIIRLVDSLRAANNKLKRLAGRFAEEN